MQKNSSFSEKLEAFFAGKGFYIVLFLCVAIIGVSAWVILAGTGTNVDNHSATEVMQQKKDNIAAVTTAPEAPERPELSQNTDNSHAELVESAELETGNVQNPEPEAETAVWEEAAPVSEVQAPLFIWPVNGDIEIPYSVDALIYNRTMRDWRTHDGIDVAAELGTQVMAVCSGTVENIYADDLYGTTVVIAHNDGLRSIYSNLAEMPTVSIGDGVATGEIIGAIGDTALAETGEVTHLHLSMTLDGTSVNPADYLPYR